MQPTRIFPGGLTNVSAVHPFAMLPEMSPAKLHRFIRDFDTYSAAEWIVTETQAGATQALAAGRGGRLLLTNSAADNDVNGIQNAIASFAMVAGKRAWGYAVLQVSEATQIDWVVGLQNVNTTFIDSSVTDGIYFQKDDGDAQIDVYVRKNATTGSVSKANVATCPAATDFSLGWYYDGKGEVKFYFNDVHVYTLPATSAYLPDANLTVTAAIQNGDANARSMNIDKLIFIEEV